MIKVHLLFSPYLLFFCQCLMAQTFSSEERRKETESILNIVINSAPFDKVYNKKRVYILANELLKENAPLVLKRKKCKAKYLNSEEVKKVKHYVVLGDFTLDWSNPIAVRVQIEVLPEKKLLNVRLIKENGKWVIQNHQIFEG